MGVIHTQKIDIKFELRVSRPAHPKKRNMSSKKGPVLESICIPDALEDQLPMYNPKGESTSKRPKVKEEKPKK